MDKDKKERKTIIITTNHHSYPSQIRNEKQKY